MNYRIGVGFSTAAAFSVATMAFASAPQPQKPVPADLYSGRWFEVFRTDNPRQSGCAQDTIDFIGSAPSRFSAIQTCHKDGQGGGAKTYKASAAIIPNSGNAKISLGFFGGFIQQEYWIVDRSKDNSWAIMATPAGHFVWLLSRRPDLDARERTLLLSHVRALGFDTSKVVFDKGTAGRSSSPGAADSAS